VARIKLEMMRQLQGQMAGEDGEAGGDEGEDGSDESDDEEGAAESKSKSKSKRQKTARDDAFQAALAEAEEEANAAPEDTIAEEDKAGEEAEIEEGEDDDEEYDDDEEDDDDEDIRRDPTKESTIEDGVGCTAVVAVLKGSTLTVANAGDSRCILYRQANRVEPMSFDHKPMDAIEKARIEKAGSFITNEGRVNGNLNLSR
jgi:serine/threonine protein phosphatase PrpC